MTNCAKISVDMMEPNYDRFVPVPRNLRHIEYSTIAPRWRIRELRAIRKYVSSVRQDHKNMLHWSNDLDEALTWIAQDNAVARRVLRALKHEGYRSRKFVDDDFDIDENGNVLYRAKGQQTSLRSFASFESIKPGRFVRRLLAKWMLDNIHENEIRDFAERMRAAAERLRITVGVEFLDVAYSHDDYTFESCMQGLPVAEFYEEVATDSCVVAYRNETLLGRAIIWERPDIVPGCKGFIDRIYGDQKVVVLIKRWAHEHGFAHKSRQNSTCTTLILPNGNEHILTAPWKCKDSLVWNKDMFFPYTDTYAGFRYGVGLVPYGHPADIYFNLTSGRYALSEDNE